MRKIFALLVTFALFGHLFAQNRTITGTVLDANGIPLPGVSVVAIPSRTGTTTDNTGKFLISIPANARLLEFSAVNFATQSSIIGSRTTVDVRLVNEDKSLAEVVVVGFGTARRKDVTSSIATIGSERLRDQPIQSFDQALSGKAAGLNVTLPNGVLNNPPVIRIRGVNSLSGSSTPLIVVDGVPVFTGDISSNLSANNALGNINPSDIESIEILKDASAAAIYGSRAANGVMLITTKKGKGRPKVNYETWVGWTKPFRLFNVLRAQDYVTIKNEGLRNLNGVVVSGQPAGAPLFFLDTLNGQVVDTRWQDEVYQTGFQHNHNLSVSGSSQGTRYFFSANYTKQEGMIQTNTFERAQMRMNIDQKVNEWLSVGGNFNFSRGSTASPSTGSIPGTPFNTAGAARLAFITAPNVSPFAADGRYNIIGIDNPVQRNNFNQIGRNKNLFNSGLVNPVLVRDLNTITSQSDQLLGDINATFKIARGLTFRTQYGVNYQTVEDKTFYNQLHGDGIQTTATTDDGTAFNTVGKYNITNFQNYFTFDRSIQEKHNLNLLVGHEEQSTRIDRWGAKRSGLTDAFYNEFQGNFTINDNPVGNSITENYLMSFFGRVNYNFNNRYYVSGTLRRDGYSAFSQGNKWGTFAGGSIGWNISDEGFWNEKISKTVNLLRLRASYGQVGNLTAVSNFASLSTFGSAQYGQGFPTLFFNQAGNPDLKWETSTKADVGLQFGLFNDRINGEIGYYNTKLKDLIIPVPTPPSMGVPGNSIEANAASMYNRGIEVNLNFKVIQNRAFKWSSNFNLTTQKNRITKLAPGVEQLVGTTQLERTNITRVGYSVGSFFAVRSNGVDAQSGQRIFLDSTGKEVLFNFASPVASRWRYRDGSIARPIDLARDGHIIGNALPTVYGGFNNTFEYRGFDLGIDIYYSLGNKVYFGSRAGLLDQRFWNNTTDVLDRWQKPGDQTNIPRVVFNDNISNGSAFPISENLFSGDFMKVRSLRLGYTFDGDILNRSGLSSVRLYGQVFNPFVITNYPGTDPEISVNGAGALTPGVDRNSVGQARTFTLGINVGF